MLIAVSLYFRHEAHQEPLSEVGSLSPTKSLMGFERETFQFDDNALTH